MKEKNFFSKVLISKIGVKIKFRIITKNMQWMQPQNRFYGILSSRGPPASVRVKVVAYKVLGAVSTYKDDRQN